MACLSGPPRCVSPTQEHDITRSGRSSQATHAKRVWDLQDSASVVSVVSMASNHSCPSPLLKAQIRHCLDQYKILAVHPLNGDSAKEAAFWCSLGLGVTIASVPTSPPQVQSPLSAESRTSSNGSIASVSDSGFAPSVDTKPRHCLSLSDPEIGSTLTNLVAGLAGGFASQLLDPNNACCLFPAGVNSEFDTVLAQLSLSREQRVDLRPLATKIATQLLSLLQNEFENTRPLVVSYWDLCLQLLVALIRGDSTAVNAFTNELEKRSPPASLTEPALSYIPHPHEDKPSVPFPALESHAKFPHHVLRQTRSRAASLMSHSSLRSFSSVRSIGNLSPKSSATFSISRGISFTQSPTEELSPTGSFVLPSPSQGKGSMDSLSRVLYNHSQRTSLLHLNFGHTTTAPSSPLRPTPTFSRSASSDDNMTNFNSKGKGKGKENDESLGLGLRPGAAGVSARTGTRFAMTCPPTPTGSGSGAFPKLDPVLAALEKGSKLKSKSACLNCGTRGSNYPCCPRCGESWCSRQCRVEANKGGKHVCKRATAPLSPQHTL